MFAEWEQGTMDLSLIILHVSSVMVYARSVAISFRGSIHHIGGTYFPSGHDGT